MLWVSDQWQHMTGTQCIADWALQSRHSNFSRFRVTSKSRQNPIVTPCHYEQCLFWLPEPLRWVFGASLQKIEWQITACSFHETEGNQDWWNRMWVWLLCCFYEWVQDLMTSFQQYLSTQVITRDIASLHRVFLWWILGSLIYNLLQFAVVKMGESTEHHLHICYYFISAVGTGNGKDLRFEIIINGSPIYQFELMNGRPGQV